MVLDVCDFVLIMLKLKVFEKVFDFEKSMYIVIVENYKKQLERKEYFIVVVGKING